MIRDGFVPQWTDRTEHGRKYTWHRELGFWYNAMEKGDNPVQIFPATDERSAWYVVVPRTSEFYKLVGSDAEQRAFAIAQGFATQNQDG